MHPFKLIAIIFISAFAGCKSISYFDSPNHVSKYAALVNMLDGSQKKGLLTINIEVTYTDNFIILSHDGITEKILIDNIKSYTDGNNFYVPKQVTLDYDGPLRLLFLKRLTPDSSRIHLYELYQNNWQRDTRDNLLMYFISLPAFDRLETWGMGNKNLVPNFDFKMSQVVADCPALSEKIYNKQKGYSFSQLTLSPITQKEVLAKIIDDTTIVLL
jgi:hypothetical protein